MRRRPMQLMLADLPGAGHAAIAALLSDLPHAALTAVVDDATQLLPTVERTRPDVLIVDDRLLRAARWTAAELGICLIVVGVDDDPAYSRRAERMGAATWIAKDRADAVLPALLAAPTLFTLQA